VVWTIYSGERERLALVMWFMEELMVGPKHTNGGSNETPRVTKTDLGSFL